MIRRDSLTTALPVLRLGVRQADGLRTLEDLDGKGEPTLWRICYEDGEQPTAIAAALSRPWSGWSHAMSKREGSPHGPAAGPCVRS